MRTACLLAALLAAGCGADGPTVYPAGGTVRFRGGGPVTAGLVEFAPADGGPSARGRIGPDGTFTLATGDRPGAAAGPHRVAVLPVAATDRATSHRHKAGVVHPKHARLETSGLSATVAAGGPNQFTLDVEPAP